MLILNTLKKNGTVILSIALFSKRKNLFMAFSIYFFKISFFYSVSNQNFCWFSYKNSFICQVFIISL